MYVALRWEGSLAPVTSAGQGIGSSHPSRHFPGGIEANAWGGGHNTDVVGQERCCLSKESSFVGSRFGDLVGFPSHGLGGITPLLRCLMVSSHESVLASSGCFG